MNLTSKEKKAFILPSILALILLGLLIYNHHTLSLNQKIQLELNQIQSNIFSGQQTLSSIQKIAGKEKLYAQYQLDQWIPLFHNLLEVKLFIGQKVTSGLAKVKGKEKNLLWITNETPKPHSFLIGQFSLEAIFPSYLACQNFLKEMESSQPFLIPQKVEIKKEGLKLESLFTFSFAFRMKDEKV